MASKTIGWVEGQPDKPSPVAMRLASSDAARNLAHAYMKSVIDSVASYVSDSRPMDNAAVEKRRLETLEAIAAALDSAGVATAVENLEAIVHMYRDAKSGSPAIARIWALKALAALTGAVETKVDACPGCGEDRDPKRTCPNPECRRLPEPLIKELL